METEGVQLRLGMDGGEGAADSTAVKFEPSGDATSGGAPSSDIVTQVVEIEVKPDVHDEIEAWFTRIHAAARTFDGHLSTTGV